MVKSSSNIQFNGNIFMKLLQHGKYSELQYWQRADTEETVNPCMLSTLPTRLWSFTNVICVASKLPLVGECYEN